MRITLTSDWHGHLPPLPDADLLIVAGDLCPDFGPGTGWGTGMQEGWLASKFANHLGSRRYAATFGNHDFVTKRGMEDSGIPLYVDETICVDGVYIWVSPWSPLFGGWAWMKSDTLLAEIYEKIPAYVDIIVSHGPPYGYGDLVDGRYVIGDEDRHVGSKSLLAAIDRVKPKLVICGHIHSAHGTYQHGDTRIMNVSLVNEEYKVAYPIEIVEWPLDKTE